MLPQGSSKTVALNVYPFRALWIGGNLVMESIQFMKLGALNTRHCCLSWVIHCRHPVSTLSLWGCISQAT